LSQILGQPYEFQVAGPTPADAAQVVALVGEVIPECTEGTKLYNGNICPQGPNLWVRSGVLNDNSGTERSIEVDNKRFVLGTHVWDGHPQKSQKAAREFAVKMRFGSQMLGKVVVMFACSVNAVGYFLYDDQLADPSAHEITFWYFTCRLWGFYDRPAATSRRSVRTVCVDEEARTSDGINKLTDTDLDTRHPRRQENSS
jgi:hypothetical protein